MKDILRKIYQNKNNIYRVALLLIASTTILYLFPKGMSFRYDFQKGKPWMYDDMYAPFDFQIYKTDEELREEQQNLKDNTPPYYNYDEGVVEQIKNRFSDKFDDYFNSLPRKKYHSLYNKGLKFIDSIYDIGVALSEKQIDTTQLNLLKSDNRVEVIDFDDLFKISEIEPAVSHTFFKEIKEIKEILHEFLFNILAPNVSLNKTITERSIEDSFKKISLTRGSIDKGKRIIVKGEIVEGNTYRILDSLKKEFQSQTWSKERHAWLVIGYIIFILLTLTLLQLYIRQFHYDIYEDNRKIMFIYLNIILMVGITQFAVNMNSSYVYAVPICILPLVMEVFLDKRVAFVIFIITLLLLGFIVPNGFEFLFMQSSAGLVILIGSKGIHRRTDLFLSVGKILSVYVITYVSFNIIHEGEFLKNIKITHVSLFLINALSILFVQPITYIYEKLFTMVSDLSLLELTDTNTPLLKELAEKAPGTFNHSLQVANLAETAANNLNANTLLVRVGALYHDIGKMQYSTFFTENQLYISNPHDDITPKESAKIIISHVMSGIKLGKKYRLPDRVIDFIRTHHGTSLVQYFYHKEKEQNPDANPNDFRYSGPIPFSKETVILMMSDAVEASSRSLKYPTQSMIDNLIEKVISSQINEGQFLNSNITLHEIERVKRLFKKKLANIYKLRIEYPE